MSENILSKVTENRLGFLHFKACAATDIGKRKNNEDSFLVNENMGLFIVADGMGGHELGEYASWFASKKVEKIVSILTEFTASSDNPNKTVGVGPDINGENYEAYLKFAITLASSKLKEDSEEKGFNRPMGTTLVALFFKDNKAYIANIGDSRAYKISSGNLSQITHDHSAVAREVRMGKLSPKEAKTAKGKNVITRCIGGKKTAEADIYMMTVYPGERFLLCTDGLSNVVDEETIFNYSKMKSVKNGCISLVTIARDMGGRDNITAILVEVAGTGDKKPKNAKENDKSLEETLT